MRKVMIICLLILGSFASRSQFMLQVTAPVSYKVTIEDLYNIGTILYGNGDFTEYYLEVDLFLASGQKVLSSKSYAKRVKGQSYTWIINKSNYKKDFGSHLIQFQNTSFYNSYIKKGASFPDGKYVAVYKLLGKSLTPGTGSGIELLAIKKITFEVGLKYPPRLVYPYDGDTIKTAQPVLSWTPPFPVDPGSGLYFDLKLVEQLSMQSTKSAVLANKAYYSQSGLKKNILPYPVSAPSLKEGETYVWQIKAYTNGRSAGVTEMWSFVYQPDSVVRKNPVDSNIYHRLNPNINKVAIYIENTLKVNYRSTINDSCLVKVYEYKKGKKKMVFEDYVLTTNGENFLTYRKGKLSHGKDLFSKLKTNTEYTFILENQRKRLAYLKFMVQ